MHGFGFVNTGLLNLGWAPGLGELRSIIWQLLPILSSFENAAYSLYSCRLVLAQPVVRGEGFGVEGCTPTVCQVLCINHAVLSAHPGAGAYSLGSLRVKV